MKTIVTSLALTALFVVTASAGQYSTEIQTGPKQQNLDTPTSAPQTALHAPASGQYSALKGGPKVQAKATDASLEPHFAYKEQHSPRFEKNRKTASSKRPRIRYVGQYSANAVGPKA